MYDGSMRGLHGKWRPSSIAGRRSNFPKRTASVGSTSRLSRVDVARPPRMAARPPEAHCIGLLQESPERIMVLPNGASPGPRSTGSPLMKKGG